MLSSYSPRQPGIGIIYGKKGTGKSTLVMMLVLACVKGSAGSIEEAPFNRAVVITDSSEAWKGRGLFKKERGTGPVNIWKSPEGTTPAEWARTLCSYLAALYGLDRKETSCLQEAAVSAPAPLTFASLQERLQALMERRAGDGDYKKSAMSALAVVRGLREAAARTQLFAEVDGEGIQEAFSRSGTYIIGREAEGKEGDFLYGALFYCCLCHPLRPAPVICAADGRCRDMFPDGCAVTDRVCSGRDPSRALLLSDEELAFSRKLVRSSIVTMCSGGSEGSYVIGSVGNYEGGTPVVSRGKQAIRNMAVQFAKSRKAAIEGRLS